MVDKYIFWVGVMRVWAGVGFKVPMVSCWTAWNALGGTRSLCRFTSFDTGGEKMVGQF